MYKLFRYLCFLCFVVLTVLYFFPQNNIPHLREFYQQLNTFYEEIPSHFSQEDQEYVDATLQKNANLLLLEPNNNIKNFLNNLSTENALDLAIDRDFNDLEYLVGEYFLYNQFFEDIVLFYNGRIIYKYNQSPPSDLIVLTNDITTRRGVVHLEFGFQKQLLQKQLNQMQDSIIAKYRSSFFYSKEKEYSQDELEDLDSNNENNWKKVYKMTVSQQLKTPIDIYLVVKKSYGVGRILQVMFLMLFPLFWVLLAVVDRMIIKAIAVNEEKKQHKDFLSSMIQQTSDEEDLGWLDDFVSGEDNVKNEVEQNDNQ